ncbi:MAG: ABC transporter substrate-binding protein [Methanocorpusculaceae archaeon]|nr:ABC transporter substrate-binding protein [Methanocorpusculaceae archaeon]
MSRNEHNEHKIGVPRKGTIIMIAILVILVNLLFVSIGDYPEDNKIRVAVLLPFSGGMEEFGIEYARGVEIAVEELNGHVLPGGRTYVVDYFDTNGDTLSLLNTFLEIYNEGYPVVIGPMTSTETLAVAKYAEVLGVVLLSPGATSDELTAYGDYVFRIVSSDRYLGIGLGKIIGGNDEFENVMIIHTDDSYGVGLAELFIEELEKYHKEPKAVIEIPLETYTEDFDIDATVKLMQKINPDAVFAITPNSASFVELMRKTDSAGLSPQWFVTDNSASSEVAHSGKFAEGVIAAVPSKKGSDVTYAKRYADKFGAPMKIQDSIYGYDAMMMVAESINSRGYSAEQIRDGLRDIRYVGLSGAIVFDEKGDRYPVYDVMQVRNGEWVVLPWSEVMSFEAGHH